MVLFIRTYSLKIFRHFCTSNGTIMKFLNVAEKNDAAKNIAFFLSGGNNTRREGYSVYNKIYEFNSQVFGEPVRMVMTSVSGHLLNYEFVGKYKNWHSCNPLELFDAPIQKFCPPDSQKLKKTLEREIVSCQGLIIWTDCDREGENIGFEVIKVCTDVKPDLRIYRAKFSEITAPSVRRALNSLGQPNRNVSDAVDVRQELDLRTGAAFTRLQTLRLQKVFPQKLADKLISYGSCQFPTLGFVVERYQAIENFIEEPFWRIKMNHTVSNLTAEFTWARDRLFEKNACEAILDICKENPRATVESRESKEKSKWRPLPLDTVEMEKNVSRKLKINAKDTMKIAEKLYTQGFISYPRTETNIFPKELNLSDLVEKQAEDGNWGPFARRILNEGGPTPRQGRKSDQAHPPIHPTKYAPNLTGNEKRLYEYIVRHFLACLHKDAKGFETTVVVDIAGEKFTTKGLIVLEKNYLEVYIYEKWNAKEIIDYKVGDTFLPTILDIVESNTSPPKLLTEADLIALMEKHGIGTDATHAEHIDKIKSREYVGLHDNMYFVPGTLGMGLVEGYNTMNLEISLAKPTLRAQFENDLKLICEGRKDPEIVRREQIVNYRAVFQTVMEKLRFLDDCLATRLDDRPQAVANISLDGNDDFKSVLKCPKCGSDMFIRSRKNGPGKYLACSDFPNCKNSAWFPTNVETVTVTDETCPTCGPNVKKLKMKFKQNLFPGEPNPNIICIGGCDRNVLETLDVDISTVKQRNRDITNNDSVLRNQTNLNNFINISTVRGSGSRNNTDRPTNSNSRDSGFTSINRTNHDRSDTAPSTSSSTTRPNYLGNQNTSFMPPPSRPNNFSIPSTSGQSRVSFGNTDQQDGDITCNCNEEAKLFTVRKEGPNTGRQFYKCANSSCNFFLWAPDPNASTSFQGTQNQNSTFAADQISCNCGQPAVKRTVQKAGPNTGREFYCCPKPQNEGCRFFKWADETNDGDDGGGGGDNWRNRGNTGNSWQGKAPKKTSSTRTAPYNNGDKTRAPIKCGICREPGHTRRNCPNK